MIVPQSTLTPNPWLSSTFDAFLRFTVITRLTNFCLNAFCTFAWRIFDAWPLQARCYKVCHDSLAFHKRWLLFSDEVNLLLLLSESLELFVIDNIFRAILSLLWCFSGMNLDVLSPWVSLVNMKRFFYRTLWCRRHEDVFSKLIFVSRQMVTQLYTTPTCWNVSEILNIFEDSHGKTSYLLINLTATSCRY